MNVLFIPEAECFDTDHLINQGQFAPKYDRPQKYPWHSTFLIEAKQIRFYKDKAPYTLFKDEDRQISTKHNWDVTEKVTLMTLNVILKRFRTILNSNRVYDPQLNYVTIKEREYWFEFCFLQDVNRYVYFWSPKISTWVNDLLKKSESIKMVLQHREFPDGPIQKASMHTIHDMRFDISTHCLIQNDPGFDQESKSKQIPDSVVAILSRSQQNSSEWRINFSRFYNETNKERTKLELGWLDFSVLRPENHESEFVFYRVLPFTNQNCLLILGFDRKIENKAPKDTKALICYQVKPAEGISIQEIASQKITKDDPTGNDLCKSHGRAEVHELFTVDLTKETPYPPILLNPESQKEEKMPYPEREIVLKMDIIYDEKERAFHIAMIATNYRMVCVLTVPTRLGKPLEQEKTMSTTESTNLFQPTVWQMNFEPVVSSPESFKNLGPTSIAWDNTQADGNLRFTLSSGCNNISTFSFNSIRGIQDIVNQPKKDGFQNGELKHRPNTEN